MDFPYVVYRYFRRLCNGHIAVPHTKLDASE